MGIVQLHQDLGLNTGIGATQPYRDASSAKEELSDSITISARQSRFSWTPYGCSRTITGAAKENSSHGNHGDVVAASELEKLFLTRRIILSGYLDRAEVLRGECRVRRFGSGEGERGKTICWN